MTAKTAAYWIDDEEGDMIGVVRCPDGDTEAFARHAKDILNMLGDSSSIQDPTWRWYRMNPDPTGEFAWKLGRPDGPGRGNWRGAAVVRT